jgi:hypothetical protein
MEDWTGTATHQAQACELKGRPGLAELASHGQVKEMNFGVFDGNSARGQQTSACLAGYGAA